MGMKRRSQGFLGGALILLLAVGIVKVMGALFKIPLNAAIGDVGMGYFGTAYTIYNPIFSLATAGLPVAVSRLVSENRALGRFRDVRRLHAVSVPIFVLMGALASALMLFGSAPFLSFVNEADQNALPAMLVLAPAVFFGALSAIFRGYYEGLGDMREPSAVISPTSALGPFSCWTMFVSTTLSPRNAPCRRSTWMNISSPPSSGRANAKFLERETILPGTLFFSAGAAAGRSPR